MTRRQGAWYNGTMAKLSNAEVGLALGMSHSSVSRMRTGERIASIESLEKIAVAYDGDPSELLAAAAEAGRGDKQPWIRLLERLFDDGESPAEELQSI